MKSTQVMVLVILLNGLFAAGCGNNSSSTIHINAFYILKEQGIIQEKTQQFTEAHIIVDTALLNNSFTSDARVLPPNADAVIGRAAIAALNYEWVNFGIHEFTETSTFFYGNEEYLIDEGTYYLRYGEDNTIDNGKYINIWKKENNDWKLYSNTWNTSIPRPAGNW